jgi:phosphoesterase RecJ-like protein
MSDNISKFKQLIQDKENFLLITHLSPDGDAVGATVAFFEFLKSLGKSTRMIADTPVPQIFSYLKWADQFENDFLVGDFDVIVLLDCGDLRRSGFADRILESKRKVQIINIDHHPQNDIWKIATVNLADPNAPSTCQILYKLFVNWEVNISIDQATALLTGIYYDTGGFLHSNTDNQVLDITSQLLRLGAKLKQIQRSVSQSRTAPMLKLWGLALNEMTIDKKLGLIISIIRQKDIKKLNACEEDLSGLVNVLDLAEEAKAAILLYETSDGKIKGSLRTEKDNVDVAQIAAMFGGGGHKKAAGFTVDGKFEKTKSGWKII